jgi:RNA polymerase sigma factor (sigma-70 family)
MKNIDRQREELFSAAYKKYYILVREYIYRKVKDIHIAEDLTQKTFLKVLNSNFTSWEDTEHFKRFTLCVAKNCYLNYIRYMSQPTRSFVRIGDTYADDLERPDALKYGYSAILGYSENYQQFNPLELLLSSTGESTELNKGNCGLIKKIKVMINSMPPKQKKAMIFVYFLGVRPKHTAWLMNTTANCVSFLIHKGTKELKKKLKYVQNIL